MLKKAQSNVKRDRYLSILQQARSEIAIPYHPRPIK